MKEKKQKRAPVPCSKYASDIFLVYGINLNQDSPQVHSESICVKCISRIRNYKKRGSDVALQAGREISEKNASIWTSFDENLSSRECGVCSSFCAADPRNNSFLQATEHDQLPASSVSTDINFEQQTPDILQPTENAENIDDNSIISSQSLPLLSSTPLKEINNANLSSSVAVPATLKKDKLFSESLTASPFEKLDDEEEALFAHFIRRKLNNSTDGSFECKSGGGKKIQLMKVPKCEKETSNAKPSTIRKRKRFLASVMKSVAGQSQESQTTQQACSLKNIPKTTKTSILKKAGISENLTMDNKTVLSLKEETDLSFKQLRTLKRFMKKAGLKMENEQKSRDLAKELTVPIETEMKTFFDKEENELHVPFCRVQITPLVLKMLDTYDNMNLLTNHDGNIPDDEVWVKFGGDHGKGSLKFSIQIINLEKPNSKKNTFIVGMAEIKDTYKNLEICMKLFEADLIKLSNTTWNGKKIKVFYFGDYEFITKLCGLSGATGTYPCVWCLVNKKDMKESPKPAKKRTTKMLKTGHRRFLKYGRGNKKKVARYHNCLNKPLLTIELDHVAPPLLHLELGLVLRHHRLLEAAADNIDAMLARQSEDDALGEGESVRAFGNRWKEAEQLKKETNHLYGKLQLENDTLTESLTEDEKKECTLKLEEVQEAIDNFKRGEEPGERQGPVCFQNSTTF